MLFVALGAVAATATLAAGQDMDAGAQPRVRDAARDAVRPVEELERHAQWPLTVFSIGAAADWTSTAWALGQPFAHEDNPTIAWAKSPAAIIAAGAGIDAVGAYAWMKGTARHPRIRAAGFFFAAAFRGYLVVQNVRNNRDRAGSQRRP